MSGADNEQNQYLTFFVAGEEYALGILEVKEIVQYSPVTRLPSMPAAIRGATNLRGRVVPVVDLAVQIGLDETAITKWTCILMVEAALDGEQTVVGLLCDRVSQVLDLPPEQIEPPPSFGTRLRAELLRGLGKQADGFVQILSLERLLEFDALLGGLSEAQPEEPAEEPPRSEGEPAGPEAGGPRS